MLIEPAPKSYAKADGEDGYWIRMLEVGAEGGCLTVTQGVDEIKKIRI